MQTGSSVQVTLGEYIGSAIYARTTVYIQWYGIVEEEAWSVVEYTINNKS